MQFIATSEISSLLRDTLGGSFVMATLTDGLLNQNVLVTMRGGGEFVFKVYRPEVPRTKVDETHRVMKHASRRGIPVALPIATYEVAGFAAALYPFVGGVHPSRYGAGRKRIAAMGEMLGRITRRSIRFGRPGRSRRRLRSRNGTLKR